MALKKTTPAAVAAPVAEAKTPALKLMKSAKVKPVEAVEVPAEAQSISEAMTDDLIEKTVHEIENLKEDRAFKLVAQLLDGAAHDNFRLGGVLSVVQAQGWYMDRGYENFRAYVEAECGMQYRKACYLIAIYNGLVASGVSWEKVKHLGWTKLADLAAILTPENVDEWVGVAENMTVPQLQEYIKSKTEGSAGSAGGDDPAAEAKKTTSMSFKLHQDQKETVKEALAKAKHESGTEVDAVALEMICLNFLGGTSKLAKAPTLAESMAGKSAEEILGVFAELFPDVGLEVTLPE